MHIVADAIVLSVRTHGESGAVVRALTPNDGVRAGYVRGGHARRLRPVLQPGNTIRGTWRARTDDQLAALAAELVRSLAPLHAEPLAAAAIDWLAALTVTALPEAQPYPRVHAALSATLDAVAAAPSARGWTAALVRYELLLLAELGFGLDLSRCAATGRTEDLGWVSPRSAAAVSRAAAAGYEARLLRLPAFLAAGGSPDWDDVFAGAAITAHFLSRDVLVDRRAAVLDARARLFDRLRRAVA